MSSNITSSFNQRCFLIPKIDLTTEAHIELVMLIMRRHGNEEIKKIKLIDENDECDSFLVETKDFSFCVKTSLDQIAIFYEFLILKGIENLCISPIAIDRGEVEFGKTIYYTIQTFEHSNNLLSLGVSSLLDSQYADFNITLGILHKFIPPKEVWEYFDNDESYLEYHKINFENLTEYVDSKEENSFKILKSLYDEVFNEMMNFYKSAKGILKQKTIVHGNLDASTIIENSECFKFINFENCFIGNPFFDIANLVFEMQMSGIKEYDFVTNRIKAMNLTQNKFKASEYLKEYKACKYIWTRKKFLDILKDYLKEVIILNKTKIDKISKLGTEFSNHFYRFNEISAFEKNKDMIVQEFSSLLSEI